MADLQLGDLVVRLNEEKGVIQFLARRAPSSSDRLGVVHEEREEGTGSVEDRVAQVVLAFLSANNRSTRFGLERYRRAGAEFAASMSSQHEDDAERDFENSMHLLDRFDDTWTLVKLDEVEELMKSAASRGSIGAESYLKDRWPQKREVLAKRLGRRGG